MECPGSTCPLWINSYRPRVFASSVRSDHLCRSLRATSGWCWTCCSPPGCSSPLAQISPSMLGSTSLSPPSAFLKGQSPWLFLSGRPASAIEFRPGWLLVLNCSSKADSIARTFYADIFANDFHKRLILNPWRALTLIRMAGGVYDFLNHEQKQLKMVWSKNNFAPRSTSQNVLELFLVKVFYFKNAVLGGFQSKKVRASTFLLVFLWIPAGWESYMTPKWPIWVPQGGGGFSQSVLPASYWSHGSRIGLPAARHALFYSHPDWG
jgi:hypothetical protein